MFAPLLEFQFNDPLLCRLLFQLTNDYLISFSHTFFCLQIDNTADWYLAQKLQISLNSAISRFGVNLFKQNKPSVVGKSPQVDKPVDQHRSSNNLATRSMHRTTQESTSSSVLKAPRPPKIFTGHSSSRSMTSKETYVRPMHEGRHSYGYGRRKPEEKQEHHRSQSRPGTSFASNL